MSTIQILMLATILIYLIGMVAIGAVLAKENRTTDDFYLGGRKLGPFVTAMSAEAAGFSWDFREKPAAQIRCYEQLASHGTSGSCIPDRYCGCRMDSHWSCHRNLCKLASGCKTSS